MSLAEVARVAGPLLASALAIGLWWDWRTPAVRFFLALLPVSVMFGALYDAGGRSTVFEVRLSGWTVLADDAGDIARFGAPPESSNRPWFSAVGLETENARAAILGVDRDGLTLQCPDASLHGRSHDLLVGFGAFPGDEATVTTRYCNVVSIEIGDTVSIPDPGGSTPVLATVGGKPGTWTFDVPANNTHGCTPKSWSGSRRSGRQALALLDVMSLTMRDESCVIGELEPADPFAIRADPGKAGAWIVPVKSYFIRSFEGANLFLVVADRGVEVRGRDGAARRPTARVSAGEATDVHLIVREFTERAWGERAEPWFPTLWPEGWRPRLAVALADRAFEISRDGDQTFLIEPSQLVGDDVVSFRERDLIERRRLVLDERLSSTSDGLLLRFGTTYGGIQSGFTTLDLPGPGGEGWELRTADQHAEVPWGQTITVGSPHGLRLSANKIQAFPHLPFLGLAAALVVAGCTPSRVLRDRSGRMLIAIVTALLTWRLLFAWRLFTLAPFDAEGYAVAQLALFLIPCALALVVAGSLGVALLDCTILLLAGAGSIALLGPVTMRDVTLTPFALAMLAAAAMVGAWAAPRAIARAASLLRARPWAPFALLGAFVLLRVGGPWFNVLETVTVGGVRVPLTVLNVPLVAASAAAALALEVKGWIRALSLLGVLVGGLALPALRVHDLGLLLLAAPPILLVVTGWRFEGPEGQWVQRAVRRVGVSVVAVMVVVVTLVGIASERLDPRTFADSSGRTVRVVEAVLPGSAARIGTREAELVATHLAILRRYAQGRSTSFAGDGFLDNDLMRASPALLASILTDGAAAVFLFAEFGTAGAISVGLLYVALASVGGLGGVTGRRRVAVAQMLLAYVALSGIYMFGGDIGVFPLTGRNVPFLVACSTSDLLEPLALLALAAWALCSERNP